MENLQAPKTFEQGSNPAGNWKTWKKRFMRYANSIDLFAKPNVRQVNVLLHVAGDEVQDVADTFKFLNAAGVELAEADITYEMLMERLDNHYVPKTNVTFERRQFFSSVQGNKSIDDYVTELRRLARTCEYENLTDDFIKDQLVGGIANEQVKERLLRTDGLSLNRALEIARAAELSRKHMESFMPAERAVNALQTEGRKSYNNSNKRWQPNIQHGSKGQYNEQKRKALPDRNNRAITSTSCSKCGLKHNHGACPAFGKECFVCKKRNHYARMCRMKSKTVKVLATEDEADTLFIDGLTEHTTERKEKGLYAKVKIANTNIKFKLDTGAQANVISKEALQSIKGKMRIEPTAVKLRTYTNGEIPLIGQIYLLCEIGNRKEDIKFLVTKDHFEPVLGVEACTEIFHLLHQTVDKIELKCIHYTSRASDIIRKYDEVFKGMGRLKGEYHITIQSDAVPVVHAARKIPFALLPAVEKELQKMIRMGIITKVEEPTEWVHPMIIVHKPDGSLRICLDPGELNRVMKRPHFKMPTIEDIASRLQGAQVFTVLDAVSAFWQKKLDNQSSRLCTFSTPFGRYRFLVMPYGIAAAPEVFQNEMTRLYGGEEKAAPVMDDVLVWGKDYQDHDTHLESALKIAKNEGLRFKKEKLQLSQTTVRYLGHVFSSKGMQIDPERVAAIQNLEPPQDRKALQRILGTLNYLVRFLPKVSEKMLTLRRLLRQNSVWDWSEKHQEVIEEIKTMIVNAPILKYYDPKHEVVLKVDASPYGLGALLEQEGAPVAFASSTLTECQQRYSHIEKELMAVVFGLEKFHQYVYGQRVVVYTDHKPLIAMSAKTIATLTPRIQRFFMRLQRYDVELRYKPGKEMFVPDMLSRAPNRREVYPTPDEDIQIVAEMTAEYVKAGDTTMENLRTSTTNDPQLSIVANFVVEGWPKTYRDVPKEVKSYWQYRDTISMQDGLLLRGSQILIPRNTQETMLRRLHNDHQGIVLMKARARRSIFWPGMTTRIEQYAKACTVCENTQNRVARAPLIAHSIPGLPWRKVALDYFDFNGEKYMQLVDYYSKYIEVARLVNLTGKEVIPVIKSMFSRHGIPEELVTDGGPPHNGSEFANFLATWQIKHVLTSPYHSQSNGAVERTIQTVKRMYKKVLEDSKDPYLAMLTLRTTPVCGSIWSPDELLMGRRLRTMIPSVDQPQMTTKDHNDYRQLVDLRKSQMVNQTTPRAREAKPLQVGDRVKYKSIDDRWRTGFVQTKREAPRSYVVKTDIATQIVRNRKDIRTSVQKASQDHVEQSIDLDVPQVVPNGQLDNNQEQDCVPQPGHYTRRGRKIVLPNKYNDFVM